MNSLCYDESRILILKYELTGDPATDIDLENWLEFEYRKSKDAKNVWEFGITKDVVKFVSVVKQTIEHFEKVKLELDVCEKLRNVIDNSSNQDKYADAVQKAIPIKRDCPICNKTWAAHTNEELKSCQEQYKPKIGASFKRPLMPYQKVAIDHLLAIGNGANFSVPGSGKTAVTYAVLSNWLEDETIDKILVIGPTSSFFPWEDEFRLCFGRSPKCIRVKGEIGSQLPNLTHELFLMHFSTAMYRIQEIIEFLSKYNVALIIDESHNIKSPDQRTWARTARAIAPYAKRKMILSGTPMPNDARDLWVQITFLWPYDFPLGNDVSYMRYAKTHGIGKWKNTLEPLFTRTKKSDLGLPKPEPFKKYYVDLHPIQSEIYKAIAAKTLQEIYDLRDKAKLQQFRVAKMIRMLQVASNPSLIFEKSDEFDVTNDEFGIPNQKVNLSSIKNLDREIFDKIVNYSKLEIPAKLVEATKITKKLLGEGKKVIIWSSFITNMHIFENQLLKEEKPILIYGDISREEDDEVNRDKLIQEFKDDPNPRVLIATPASLAESVSLHVNSKKNNETVCYNAIYLDRNFNGAQFMQSMDRIHRLGMKQDTKVVYHCLIAKKTIDEKIDERLWDKFTDMSFALNDAWPTVLDYDGSRKDIPKNEAQKDYTSLVDHLKELREKEDGN